MKARPGLCLAGSAFALLLAARLPGAPAAGDEKRPAAMSTAVHAFTYPHADYVETGRGRSGGTLHISVASDTGTLDLQTIAATNPKWLGRLLFDNLVYLDEHGAITPWIAERWDISADGLTYVFHLRDGVTFSDGTPLDAAAVKANLDRIVDPASHTAMTAAYIAPYARSRVVDRRTLEVTLSRPYSAFLNVLAQSWFGLVSPRSLAGPKAVLATRPVGSGPFIVASYRRQSGITFVRRPDYRWAPPYIGHAGPAYLDRIAVTFVPEALPRYVSLVSGQFDLTIDAPPQNAAAIRANPDLVLGNRINLGNPTRAITFNTTLPPFNELAVRQAFALAIDRAAITRANGFGEYRPTGAFLSAITPHAAPGIVAPGPDVAAANRLLDKAGWAARDADGVRRRGAQRLQATLVQVDAGTALSPIVVAIQADARKIGLRLDIRQVTAPQLTQIRARNAYQALGPGYWHTNTPDGLYIVYHGQNIANPRFTGQNTSRIADPQLDSLLNQARATRDPARQDRLYAAAQARLAVLVPAVPLFENHTLVAYHRHLRGMVYDTSHNMPFLTTAWLSEPRS
ncbi:MAG: ABC transporter substrate-binding protein [Novosphingobium aromaticivorans]|nr:ABC transporter substrate-binding protein [Novosphingobium aromaticivorans]